ncbi:MAG TPA: GAF domain-containing protein, partial [Methylomirabilota bacterium]
MTGRKAQGRLTRFALPFLAPFRRGNGRASDASTDEKSRRLETLARLTNTLTATLATDDVLRRVVEAAVELFPGAAARLWLVDGDGGHLALAVSAGGARSIEGDRRLALGEGLTGAIGAGRQPLTLSDAATDARAAEADGIIADGL